MKEESRMSDKQMKTLGWVATFIFKKERDLPLAAANAPGIIFGLITALTALF